MIFLCLLIFLFQNVHLLPQWLGHLEELLENTGSSAYSNYRVFMSGEPVPSPHEHLIPRTILENSLKLTTEPPSGMNSSLHAALDNFTQVFTHFPHRQNQKIHMWTNQVLLWLYYYSKKVETSSNLEWGD